MFRPGDPIPMFACRAANTDAYHFDTVAGRYIVLSFLGSSVQAPAAELIKKAAKIQKGSSKPLTEKVASITRQQLKEIAAMKMHGGKIRDRIAARRSEYLAQVAY